MQRWRGLPALAGRLTTLPPQSCANLPGSQRCFQWPLHRMEHCGTGSRPHFRAIQRRSQWTKPSTSLPYPLANRRFPSLACAFQLISSFVLLHLYRFPSRRVLHVESSAESFLEDSTRSCGRGVWWRRLTAPWGGADRFAGLQLASDRVSSRPSKAVRVCHRTAAAFM